MQKAKWGVLALLIFHCALVFCFSAQPAIESKEVSGGITRKILMLLPVFQGDAPATEQALSQAEHVIRKIAHFSLFFLLGVYACLSSEAFLKKKTIMAALAFCLLYAISDETHQFFVEGRSAQITDVMIDFSGSVCGIYLTLYIQKLLKRRERI